MSTRCAFISSRPSSNTAKSPTGPAPTMRTSVLMVSLILYKSPFVLLSLILFRSPRESGGPGPNSPAVPCALDSRLRGYERSVLPARANASRNPFLIQCGGTAAAPRIRSQSTIGNLDQTQEFHHILLRSAAAGRKGHIGLGVKGLAAAQNGDEVLHRPRAVRHRAHVALRHHAFHVLLGCGLHPDREAGREQQLERARLGDDAARGRDHEAFVPAQHVVERLAFGAPEGLLAEHVEDLAQGCTAALLDLAVELDEGEAEPLGRELAEGRFAATAQADQRDAMAARIVRRRAEMAQQKVARFRQCRRRQPLEELVEQHEVERRLGAFMYELSHGQADGARDPSQQHDRAIAEPGLELGEVALGDFCMTCEGLAGHAALVAQHTHALAEPAQIGIGLAAGWLCSVLAVGVSRLGHGSDLTCIIMPGNRVIETGLLSA